MYHNSLSDVTESCQTSRILLVQVFQIFSTTLPSPGPSTAQYCPGVKFVETFLPSQVIDTPVVCYAV